MSYVALVIEHQFYLWSFRKGKASLQVLIKPEGPRDREGRRKTVVQVRSKTVTPVPVRYQRTGTKRIVHILVKVIGRT